jgi:hypothetical protein
MDQAPWLWLSGTGGGQPAARKALAREVLVFRARQAYRAAISTHATEAAWAVFEDAVDQLPDDDDPLRDELRTARAAHEVHLARIEAGITMRWTTLDAELAASGDRPVTAAGSGSCPTNKEHADGTLTRSRPYGGPRHRSAERQPGR